MKSIFPAWGRQILAIAVCLLITAIVLTDPLFAAVMVAGRRMRRPRPEKTIVAATAASTPRQNSP